MNEQRRAGDAPIEAVGLATGQADRRPGAHVVVELPAKGPVLVLVAAVDRQVSRLRFGEVRIGLLHALEGVFQGGIALRDATGELAQVADPFHQAFVARRRVVRPRGRHAHALDGHELRHRIGVQARIGQGHRAAHGVADQHDVLQAGLADQLRDVVDVVDRRVGAAHQPLGIAVAAQVRGDDVVVRLQRLGHPVPVPAMVASAVHQQHGRGAFVAPVHVVQTQPLREVDVRRRAALEHRIRH